MKIAVFDRMEECTDAEVQRMLPLVSPQRREQALRFRHLFGRFCCLKSWLMLQDLILECTKPNESFTSRLRGIYMSSMDTFRYNEHGKPYLEGGPFFSISHCKTGIAVAVSDEPVGIDIEQIRSAGADLIERTMNEEEQRLIRESEQPDRTFTRLWTQKEAIVKCQGIGIESFEQLQTVLNDAQWTLDTIEKEKYIVSIAYGQLRSFSAKVQTADL